jgi:hypothetical protein
MMVGLIDLAKNAVDERVRAVCLVAVLDRAGVSPADYDPSRNVERPEFQFDPRAYTPDEFAKLEEALKLLMEQRQVVAPKGTGGQR